ncbi:MAG TPA: Ig-like domain-containing protein [Candidatus Dormibacteraeota bacterium]|nr:Ig-like domain-containing protein [Candidatus Dormibacteraeota bacterium]
MSGPHFDPELNDVLQDPELLRLAGVLSQGQTPAPPLDDAFKSALRRQLMDMAWRSAEGKDSWWRLWLSPPRLSWIAAAAVVVMIASVVIYTAAQPPGGFNQVIIESPQQDQSSVALHQPILVSFNQPMDHPSTEKAVQITPATNVDYAWNGDAQLYIQPVSGDLAPNTQYQVTIGPGALTKNQQPLSTPTTITFVTTQSTPAPPSPSPTPRVTTSLLTNQQQLATIPSAASSSPVWSPDSTAIYYVGPGGALVSVPAKGGSAATLVATGASLPTIDPAGGLLAYVRAGKIEVLSLKAKTTDVIAPPFAPTALRWVGETLYFGTSEGVYSYKDTTVRRAGIQNDQAVNVISISPDGLFAVYQGASSLFLLDVAGGGNVQLGGSGAAGTFQAWSPNGQRLVYGNIIADLHGKTVSTLPDGEVAWSAQNVILLGSDTGIYSIRPDGTDLTKLADGTFHAPVWAPDSSTFVFVRGDALYDATAPTAKPQASATAQASAVVNAFMSARRDNEPDKARGYLDDSGKAAYGSGNLALIPSSDLQFKRFYILVVEVDPSSPNTVRAVVRMVFGKDKQEKSAIEETLILQRGQDTDPFLIDGATASAPRDLGKGPNVVSVKVTGSQLVVTFDSDLLPNSVGGVVLQDSTGAAVQVTPVYNDRELTFSGLQLTPGARYRLVVQPTVQDVGNRNPAAEYDLDFVGPAAEPASGGSAPPPAPSPSPLPTPTTVPGASPIPTPTPG